MGSSTSARNITNICIMSPTKMMFNGRHSCRTLGLLLTLMLWAAIMGGSNSDKIDYNDPDCGGNRGYSLSFSDYDQYAGTAGYFSPSTLWPTNEITVSAWVRLTSFTTTSVHDHVHRYQPRATVYFLCIG